VLLTLCAVFRALPLVAVIVRAVPKPSEARICKCDGRKQRKQNKSERADGTDKMRLRGGEGDGGDVDGREDTTDQGTQRRLQDGEEGPQAREACLAQGGREGVCARMKAVWVGRRHCFASSNILIDAFAHVYLDDGSSIGEVGNCFRWPTNAECACVTTDAEGGR